jgi:hypothetical protein
MSLRTRITRLVSPPPRPTATATTAIAPRAPRILAYLFTTGSAIWTLYSVWDLLGAGVISITAGAGAEGLWVGGMLAYRVKPTRLTGAAMVTGLAGTLAILAIHGAGAYHWGGIVAVVPPLAAELFWHITAQLSTDPTDLTPQQQAEVNDVIREARHVTVRAAAEQALEDAEHAAKLARIRRDGELRQAEDLADFDVAVSRIDMQRQIARRAPLMISAPQGDLATEDDQQDDHPGDHAMTTIPASRPARDMVTSVVTPPVMTDRQMLAAARRLDQQARRQKPSRPVTIETLQQQLGLSRRDATDLRRAVVGKGE